MMEIAKESLEIKRKTIEDFTSKGLYPYSKYYLSGVKKPEVNILQTIFQQLVFVV